MKKVSLHESEIATAPPVWHERVYGCRLLPPSRRRRAIERYLREVVAPTVPILPYEASAAEWHASERARLRRLGKTWPFVDGQIAGVARVNGLELVTTRFEDYRDFEGIT
ncbi:MAG: VapC toxin family PIN domain ribonuclease, partial [Candidatus Methylomirabilales bacterium]